MLRAYGEPASSTFRSVLPIYIITVLAVGRESYDKVPDDVQPASVEEINRRNIYLGSSQFIEPTARCFKVA